MELDEKNVVITGASRGLGRALALRLADAGARVVLVARHLEPLREVVREIEARGGVAHAVEAAVGERDAAARIAGIASGLLGTIDVLIHNASTLGPVPLRALTETRVSELEEVLAVNLVGPFALTNAIVGAMANRGHGVVVHISSDAAVEAYPTWGAYSVAKAGLDHLNRIYAAELSDQGVRFVAVDPGEMDTRMHADAMPDVDPSTLARPEEIAERIATMLEGIDAVSSGARVAATSFERTNTRDAGGGAA